MDFPLEYYSYNNIPLNRDMFIISDNEYATLIKHWRFFLDDEDPYTMHPNWIVKNARAAVAKITNDFIVIEVFLNTTYRFHSAVLTLPKEDFCYCLENYNYQKQPIIIVSDKWMKKALSSFYSVFCMVDAIGIKKVILEKGGIPSDLLRKFSCEINSLARKYPSYTFLSFGDSVVIKGSFRPDKKYYVTYRPEQLLEIAEKVKDCFKEVIGYDSYAIFSQGLLYDYENKGITKSWFGKHYSLGSLGTPFSEIFEIDSVARSNSKKGTHPPSEIYMTDFFFHTLNTDNNKRSSFQKYPYKSKMSFLGKGEYCATCLKDLKEGLNKETIESRSKNLRFKFKFLIKDFVKRWIHIIKVKWHFKDRESELREMINAGPVKETY